MWTDIVGTVLGAESFWLLLGAASLWVAQRLVPALGAEAWSHLQASRNARRVVGLQLDPLLKAADELHGKLHSLAKEDFVEFRVTGRAPAHMYVVDLCSTLFLFGQMWARFEILRRESFHAELGRSKTGALLLRFIRTLEARQNRLVDRSCQRAIGESLITTRQGKLEVRLFREFVEDYETSERLRQWFEPLSTLLRGSSSPKVRQRILRYGVIIHGMIDTFDPKHFSTNERPGTPNKLSRRSKRDLLGRVFGVYLPFVEKRAKYIGPH